MKVNAPCIKSKETKTEVLVSTAVGLHMVIKFEVNGTSSSLVGSDIQCKCKHLLAKLLFHF